MMTTMMMNKQENPLPEGAGKNSGMRHVPGFDQDGAATKAME